VGCFCYVLTLKIACRARGVSGGGCLALFGCFGFVLHLGFQYNVFVNKDTLFMTQRLIILFLLLAVLPLISQDKGFKRVSTLT
tara:strand:- start:101 stop:349 length:249 start_codon:yes stop_codon:yes gene_type:complete